MAQPNGTVETAPHNKTADWRRHRAPPNDSGQTTQPNDITRTASTFCTKTPQQQKQFLKTALLHRQPHNNQSTKENSIDNSHQQTAVIYCTEKKHRQLIPAILHQKATPPNCANNPRVTLHTGNKHHHKNKRYHETAPSSTTRYHQIPSTNTQKNSTDNPR